MKPTGYILHEGPSLIDGAPLVVIAITSSTNAKTGDMVQTYILRADVDPINASRIGADVSTCGQCSKRWHLGGDCYVNLGHGPRAMFDGYRRGIYPRASIAQMCTIGAGRMVRLGTYGDPAAVPAIVWRALTRDARGHTGYTHQWLSDALSETQRAGIMALCMASADNETDAEMAHALGFRTFRVRSADEPIAPREFTCSASAEAGKRLTCAQCGACDGIGRKPSAASVVIIAHGARAPRRMIPIAQVQA